ncbi:hypothetical protein [Methylobacterium iners]|uniref:Uncharacterized protein n=1 Tax=Methylobacterium iners TaxID=418707 RepID=A0ABQ4S303_9HYPH|nr:hypothetical protein [Methylobacterium iners]GJD97421.1 hypothetical protein OCOJLMKI_4651 [Methylobacterium iners]
MPRLRTLLIGSALLILPSLAGAQGTPRSASECERLKNDLAYNQCLAMFGPSARGMVGDGNSVAAGTAAVAAIPPSSATGIPVTEEPVLDTGRQRGRRGRYTRGGRQTASFDVGSERRSSRRYRRRY